MLHRRLVFVVLTVVFATTTAAHAQVRPLPGDVGPADDGGTYVIQSCGETGSAEGWVETANNHPAALASGVDCPPSQVIAGGGDHDFQQAGLWVSDRLGNAGGAIEAVPGDRIERSFSSLAGTTITRVRWWRHVSKRLDNSWLAYTALDTGGNRIDQCEIDPVQGNACGVGANDWYADDDNFASFVYGYADLQGLSATKVIAGLVCRDDGVTHNCGIGSSMNRAQVMIFSAFITIADPVAPTIQSPGGPAWTSNDWVDGMSGVSLGATDVTGIRAIRAYVDGQLVGAVARSCSYTRPRPCTDEPGASVAVPTAGVADGSHTLAVGAVDAAGNETRLARPTPLRVDNRAPAPPVGLASPAATSSANAFSASWSLPADAGSPIVGARYQLCQAGTCGPVAAAPSATGVSGLALPAPGTGTLRVWLVDQRGHQDPATAATLTLAYAPLPGPPIPSASNARPGVITGTPPAPATPIPTATAPARKASAHLTLTALRRTGRRVTVVGRVAPSASGSVTIRYRVAIHGRPRTLTKRVRIVRRAFKATLTLSRKLAARTARVSLSYAGDDDTAAQTRTATLPARR